MKTKNRTINVNYPKNIADWETFFV